MDLAAGIRELAAFEPIFNAPEFGLTRADFEVHTAEDVWQVGASGSVGRREDVWTALEQRYANPLRTSGTPASCAAGWSAAGRIC